MTDFINVSELPVLESYSEGDTTLVLHEDKLYQCPEGGGGDSGAYVFVMDMATGQITHNGEPAIFSELSETIRNNEAVIAQGVKDGFTYQTSSLIDSGDFIQFSVITSVDSGTLEFLTGAIGGAEENGECVLVDEPQMYEIAVTPKN